MPDARRGDATATPIVNQRCTETDVVIIGAGVGGLRTADRLCASGHGVVVLEARDRVGGRLLSPVASAGRIDLGATWFWPNEPRVSRLVAELGLETFAQHRDGEMVVQSDSVRRAPNQLDVPSSRLVDGFQSLPEALAEHLPSGVVHLETKATAIESDGSGLVVDTPTGSWRADHVVLALPPVLAITAIEFRTPLDPTVATVARNTPVWMGSTTKIVIEFDRPFWRASGLAGSAFSYHGPMRELHDMSGPDGHPAALFGFAMVPAGEPTPGTDAVVDQVTALFGPEASAPDAVRIMDWRNEPLTVPPSALHLTDYQTYGHPLYQQPAMGARLHWASTETSPEFPGHVEGALAAAERTVSAIEATMNRSTS